MDVFIGYLFNCSNRQWNRAHFYNILIRVCFGTLFAFYWAISCRHCCKSKHIWPYFASTDNYFRRSLLRAALTFCGRRQCTQNNIGNSLCTQCKRHWRFSLRIRINYLEESNFVCYEPPNTDTNICCSFVPLLDYGAYNSFFCFYFTANPLNNTHT